MSQPSGPREARASERAAVLVVDDEADLRELLLLTLTRMGLDVDGAQSLAEARAALARRSYRLCLTDMRLGDGSGLDLVRELGARGEPPVAVITAFGSAENAVAALKAGAFDYLAKPVELEQLRLLVRSALRGGAADGGVDGAGVGEAGLARRIVGDSPQIQALRSLALRLGASMAPVAIFGESGSGKELVARAIHDAGPRRAMPFVAVNCGAIPEALMEAEFFGSRRGAFTGADRDREGFFQAASGGTLFLDEIAELPLAMQVKLLRAIQERRIRRVGQAGEEPVDVRVLSATHQDLPRLVAAGRFRQDLYYRLNVIEVRVPSLRERSGDIPQIAHALLARIAARGGVAPATLTAEAEARLRAGSFPGNVRELENILERALVLTGGGRIDAGDLTFAAAAPASGRAGESPPAPGPAPDPDASRDPDAGADPQAGAAEGSAATAAAWTMKDGVPDPIEAYLDDVERRALLAALARTGHNRTAAAQLLGISFRQMRYRMQRLGLK
jgi:two-component system response regulator PilR (NtrC family)